MCAQQYTKKRLQKFIPPELFGRTFVICGHWLSEAKIFLLDNILSAGQEQSFCYICAAN
jgi:hypothetical protein